MIHIVKEDTFAGNPRTGSDKKKNHRLHGQAAAIVLAMLVLPFSAITKQGSCALGDEFTINVRATPLNATRLTVPLSGNVILEVSEPMQRVQMVDSSIARVESIADTQLMVIGVSYGTTQLMLWSASGNRQFVEITVDLDVRALNEKLLEIDPRSNVKATTVRGNIVLTGTVSGATVAEQMVNLAGLFLPGSITNPEDYIQNHLMVSGQQQVLLRCTVAEVNRSATKSLGISGFLAGDNFQDAFAISRANGVSPLSIAPSGGINATSTVPFLTESIAAPLSTLTLGFPRVQMEVLINAMADNSLLKVLAEPNLVALSGETASFLAGGEFPIPVPQSGSSSGAITIEFREFGVRMNFTPEVLARRKIRLQIAPEVSETDFSTAIQIQGTVVPGLTQRRMESTVEIGSGQTLAVAGLLSSQVRGIANRIPGLGEVPVLGALFRSVEYRKSQSELVILVTPEIVAPMDPHQVPKVPGQDFVAPNDYELYALGLLESQKKPDENDDPSGSFRTGVKTKVAPLKSQPNELSLHGPWGYSKPEDL